MISNFVDDQKVGDLPLEVVLCFNENVNWQRLVDFVLTDRQNNLKPAEVMFRQKYIKEKFEIIGDNYVGKNPFDFNLLLSVLELFGHLIMQLRIDYKSLNKFQCETINEHLNEYCNGALTSIEFINSGDITMSELKGPFTRATYILIDSGEYQKEENDIRFDQMFPAVRRFDQAGAFSRLPSRLDYNFPNLETMTMEPELADSKFWPNLMKRLRINPQLRHVTFILGNWYHLKIVTEARHEIESVVFERFNNLPLYDDDEDIIQLDNIKVFKFLEDDIGSRSNRIPIAFGNLEEIVCDKPADKWFEIIIQNKKLEKVTIGEINDQQLDQIVTELPNLKEFVTDHKISNFTDKIVSFIQKGSKLTKVQFKQVKFETSKTAVKLLGPEWKLSNFDTFVKRH